MIFGLHALDAIAAILVAVCWFGYNYLAEHVTKTRPSLLTVVRHFRHGWIARIAERETHIADATLLSNLLRGSLFFASTTVLILGGLAALLGTAPKVAEVVSQLPYAAAIGTREAELKAMTLILIYVYAFFKFTWSAWQYNVLSIMVGAMPDAKSNAGLRARYADAGARVASYAGENYNNGIRAYYFSIALLAWLIHPLACIGATIAITLVLYRREFHSRMLHALIDATRAET